MNLGIIKMALVFIVLILFSSGCGESDEKGTDQVNDSQKEESNNSDTGQTKDEKPPALVRILEQNITYKENGNLKEETAFLKYNDNQNYSMYVLPSYELTAEEPQKDILYLKENDSIFMRIELLPDEVDWPMLEDTTKLQLSAVSTDIQTQASLESDFFLKDSIILEASNQEDVVTAYLINHKEIKLKLMMFTKINEDHRDAFIKMAKTILNETQKNEQ